MSKLEQVYFLKKELALRKARQSMSAFTQYTKRDYRMNWHHRLLCEYLDRFVAGEIRNLMVFMPPRHGKSELVSRRLPAYLLGKNPKASLICSSYSADLASMMNRDVQRIIDTEEYADLFPETRLNSSNVRTSAHGQAVRNSDQFEIIEHGGFYKSAGVGGGITGMGANYAIIDDPIKNQQDANSETVRENIWGWYTSTLYTRLQHPRSVLVTLTRWHEDDLAGRLLRLAKEDPDADQWVVLKLPARFEMDDRHERDPRKEGEALWESDFGDKTLRSIESSVGPVVWSALYQQRPSPAGGGFFYSHMFEYGDVPSKFDYTFIMGDTAYHEKQENDFTVLVHFGVSSDKLYITDVYRERIKAADIEKPAEAFIRKYAKYGFRGAYIEPKGHGIYLNQAFSRKGIMMPSENQIKDFFQDRKWNKTERASNVVPHLSNRKVIINKNINIKDHLLAEVVAFPKGVHDDFVDCLVDGVKFTYAKSVGLLDVL